MGKHERRAYLQAIQKRYRQSDRATKQTILNEFCEVCGYARKYAIRLLNRKAKPAASPTKRPGPRRKYQAEVLLEPLKRIWFASDQLCGKRLKAAIPRWLPHYEDQYGRVEMWRGSVRFGLLFPSLSPDGVLVASPYPRFHTPLIEPDWQISRIRLSDKMSRFRPRIVTPQAA
jgi:hypothetical protein